jgi:hypothetical protein
MSTGGVQAMAWDASQNVTIPNGDLVVSGTGPHAFGGAVATNAAFLIRGNFTSSGSGDNVTGFKLDQNLTGANGDTDNLTGARFVGTITTQGNSETITNVAQMSIREPIITVGSGDTVTNATTLKIESAPTEGTNNYALWVDSGATRLDGDVLIGATSADSGTRVHITAGSDRALRLSGATPDIDVPSGESLTMGINGTEYFRITAVGGVEMASTLAVTGTSTFAGGTNSFYRAVNSGNPEINLGSSGTNDLAIQTVFDSSTQVLNYVTFHTTSSSGTADKGEMRFLPDGTQVLTIDDGGLEVTGAVIISSHLTLTAGDLSLFSSDISSGGAGHSVLLGRNSNASGGAGHIIFQEKTGTAQYVWADDSALLRINTAAPTNANDTAGTVIGSQTSDYRDKNVGGAFTDFAGSMQSLRDAPLWDYTFKDDSRRGDKAMVGVVIGANDRDSWYAMNTLHGPDQIAALDEAAYLGMLHGGLLNVDSRIEALEAALAAL